MKYRTGLLTLLMVVCAALTASAQIGLGGTLSSAAGVRGGPSRSSGSIGLNSGAQLGINQTTDATLNSAGQAAAKTGRVRSHEIVGAESEIQSSTQAGMASTSQVASGRRDSKNKGRGRASNTSLDMNSDSQANARLGRNSATVNGSTSANAGLEHQGRGSMTNLQTNSSANADLSATRERGQGGKRK